MEPRIQYAQTVDGVNIAFWTMGEGPPLVYVPTLTSQSDLEWRIPQPQAFLNRLAAGRKLIRYDGRGTGLSDNQVTDFSLPARILDLEAVVDRLGLNQFAVFASFAGGPAAVAYAARCPERVSHLLLWCAYANGEHVARMPEFQALLGLLDRDWVLYTETAAHVMFGWDQGAPAHAFAAAMRESQPHEVAKAAVRAFVDIDASGALPSVRAPTLVLHRRESPLSLNVAKELVAQMPNARLVVLDGSSLSPAVGDMDAVIRAIDEFLCGGEPAELTAPKPSDVHTILFTDIENSTALTQRLGDARAQELLRAHNAIVREALKNCGGSEVKHTGDGIMASFPSASRAIECAIAIQRAVAARADSQLRMRIGLNAGEPVAEDQDLFGAAVQLARRICDRADGGAILVSDVVRQLAMGKGFLFADTGAVALKGFEDPVRLYEVRWQEQKQPTRG